MSNKINFKDYIYYCKNCNSLFNKYIEIKDIHKKLINICPFCYSDKITSKYYQNYKSKDNIFTNS